MWLLCSCFLHIAILGTANCSNTWMIKNSSNFTESDSKKQMKSISVTISTLRIKPQPKGRPPAMIDGLPKRRSAQQAKPTNNSSSCFVGREQHMLHVTVTRQVTSNKTDNHQNKYTWQPTLENFVFQTNPATPTSTISTTKTIITIAHTGIPPSPGDKRLFSKLIKY